MKRRFVVRKIMAEPKAWGAWDFVDLRFVQTYATREKARAGCAALNAQHVQRAVA